MAKDRNELDFDDGFEDMDFDFGDDDFSVEEPKDDRKPITKMATSFLEGVTKDLVDPAQIVKRAKKILPDEYTEAANLADSVVDTGRNLYNTAAAEVRPAIKDIKRTIQRTMPKAREYLPKKWADKLDEITKPEDEYKTPTIQETRDSEIAQTLGDLFKTTMEANAEQTERDNTEGEIDKKIDQKRYQNNLQALNNISGSLNRQVAYQDQITAQYQRKHLELEFRQTYLLSDIFELSKASARESKEAMADLVKNTALPETEKVRLGELGHHMFKEGLINAGRSKVNEWRRELFPNMGKNLAETVKRNAADFRDKISGVTSQLEMVQEMAGGDGPGLDAHTLAGSSLGGIAGGWLGDKVVKYLKPLAAKNPLIVQGAQKLGYEMGRLPGRIQDAASSDEYDPSFGGLIKRGIASLANPYSINTSAGDSTLESAMTAVSFTDQTRRSITEVIPGFLSRIHQELRILRTGDTSIERTVYNLDRGEFTSLKQSQKDMSERLLGDTTVKNVQQSMDELLKEIDPEGTALSPAARKELRQVMLKTAGKGGDHDVKKFANVDTYSSSLSDADRVALSDLFMERYGVEQDAEGKFSYTRGDAELDKRRNKYGKSFLKLQSDVPEPTDAIRSYVQAGQLEQLKRLGLVTTDGTTHRIDQNKIWDVLQGGSLDVGHDEKDDRFADRPGPSGSPPRTDLDLPPTPPTPTPLPPLGAGDIATLVEAYEQGNLELINAVVGSKTGNATEETLAKIYELLASGQLETACCGGCGEGGEGGGGPGLGDRARKAGGWLRGGYDGLKGAVKGAWGAQKWSAKLAGSAVGLAAKGAWGTAKAGWATGKWGAKLLGFKDKAQDIAGDVRDRAGELRDLYIKGELWPAITAQGLAAGEYFDALSGELITKFEDIKGPVKNKAGELVLDSKAYLKGLYDSKGKPVALKAWNALAGLGGKAAGLVAAPYKAAFDLARKGFDSLKAYVERPRDLYVPGETEPRLLASVMANGGYLDKASNKPVMSWKDIRGTIIDLEGNVVLTLEDLRKGLVDSAGKSLKTFGRAVFDKVKAFAVSPLTIARKGLKLGSSIAGKAWGHARSLGSKLRGKTKGMKIPGVSIGGGASEMMETIGEYQILLLEEIRDDIRALKPGRVHGDADGDGDRDGSYLDQLRNRKPKTPQLKAEGEHKPTEEKSPSWIGKLGMMLGGLLMKGMKGLKGLIGKALGLKAASGAADLAGDLLSGGKKKGLLRRGAGALGRGAWAATKGLGSVAGWAARGAMAAAPMLASGAAAAASAVGSGLMAAGTAIAGVLSAPVLLGIGAVALVGVGAWYLYKKYDASKDRPLRKLRLAQYGLTGKDEDRVKKVLALEDTLFKNITYGPEGGTLNEKSLDIPKLLEDFGFGEDDTDAINAFSQWYNGRFKPVFLTHATALHNLDASIALDAIDEDLAAQAKLTFINATKFSTDGSGPYGMTVSPFGVNTTLEAGVSEIRAAELEAVEKIKAQLDKEKGPGAGKAAAETADVTSTPAGAGQFDPNVGNDLNTPANSASATKLSMVPDDTSKPGDYLLAGKAVTANQFNQGNLDSLTAIRYKAYGLVELDRDKVNTLAKLEESVGADITYNTKRIAQFNGDPEAYFKLYSDQFMTEIPANWRVWFKARFLPVLLAQYTAVKAVSASTFPLNAGKELEATQLLQIAEALISATGTIMGDEVPVWKILSSPWPNYTLNSDSTSTRANLQYLKDSVRTSTYGEAASKGQTDAQKAASASLAQSLLLVNKQAGQGAPANGTTGVMPMAANQPFNSVAGGGGIGAVVSGGDPGGFGGGLSLVHPGAGSGGDINSLPQSKGDGTWDAHKEVIVGAAKMVGVDPGLMATMAAIESGFKSSVKAGTSSATGLFQFVSGTWREMLQKFGSKYGIAPNTPASDPRANSLLGAEYVKQNQKVVEKVIGRPATDTDLYMAHFLGGGGASKFLKQDPGAIAANVMPKEAAANKPIFFDKSGAPRTIGQVYQFMGSKIEKFRSMYAAEARSMAGLPTTGTPAPSAMIPSATDATASVPTAATTGPVGGAPDAVPTASPTGASQATGANPDAVPTAAPTGPVASATPPPPTVAPVSSLAAPSIDQSAGLSVALDPTTQATAERQQQVSQEAAQTDLQTQHASAALGGSMEGMQDILSKSLTAQQSMDASLKSIASTIETLVKQGSDAANAAPAPTPAANPASPVRGNRPGVTQAQTSPVNLRRQVSS